VASSSGSQSSAIPTQQNQGSASSGAANLTALTDKQQQEKEWKKFEVNFPPPQNASVNPHGHNIIANYFTCALENKMLLMYSITLGDISNAPTDDESQSTSMTATNSTPRRISRETKRYLIEQLLAENQPDHPQWACDYNDTIISAHPLWGTTMPKDHVGKPTPHDRTGPNNTIARVSSFVTFIKQIDLSQLDRYVTNAKYNLDPTEHLNVLNINSWKTINDDKVFKGGRVGKKFCPETLNKPATEKLS
jgi:hypothetical protein